MIWYEKGLISIKGTKKLAVKVVNEANQNKKVKFMSQKKLTL